VASPDNRESQNAPGRILTLNQIDIGWRVYSATRFHAGSDPDLPEPVGGLVVEIGQRTAVDMDTGEIETHTSYLCLDWRRAWQTLTADEINLASLEAPNRRAMAAAVRWLTGQAARAGARHRGDLTDPEIEHLTRAARLMMAAL
jgi:hypothetical protein